MVAGGFDGGYNEDFWFGVALEVLGGSSLNLSLVNLGRFSGLVGVVVENLFEFFDMC